MKLLLAGCLFLSGCALHDRGMQTSYTATKMYIDLDRKVLANIQKEMEDVRMELRVELEAAIEIAIIEEILESEPAEEPARFIEDNEF